VIVILGFFVGRLLILLSTTGVTERPPKVVAINGGMASARMPWALLLQELFELLLRRRLLAPRGTIDSPREGRSIAAITLSGFRFRSEPEKSRWLVSLRLSFERRKLLS
jgi:hypothetical protein